MSDIKPFHRRVIQAPDRERVVPEEGGEALSKWSIQAILGQDSPPDAVVETVPRLVTSRGARV